ncbi:hypothetical protein [Burkholderia sp. BCC0405]|uniref:hypothetical protein n=1 Tax=Burkholderia sp. BCC0405 TaxID=2676298 RepID=UPI001589C698|nr:hypothetical protein [Burkholderia sp. BCC0405]
MIAGIAICVTDRGVGIARDALETIVELLVFASRSEQNDVAVVVEIACVDQLVLLYRLE